MTTHTPTPWTLYKDEDGNVIALVNDHERLSQRFRILTTPTFSPRTAAENNANAEFVVKACNSHVELVEALKAAQEHLDWISGQINQMDSDHVQLEMKIEDSQAWKDLLDSKYNGTRASYQIQIKEALKNATAA